MTRRPEFRQSWPGDLWVRCFAPLILLLWWVAGSAAECLPRTTSGYPAGTVRHTESLLWRVTSPHGATSHLFGTIHLPAKEVDQPTPQLRKLVDESRLLLLEAKLDAAALAEISSLMFLPEGERLSTLIPADDFQRAKNLFVPYGIDAQTLERLKVWAAYTSLSLPPSALGTPLDLALQQRAERAGVEVRGLESLREQMGVFDGISLADQRALLHETVCHHADNQALMRRIVEAYRMGDLTQVTVLSSAVETPAEARLHERLVRERNRTLASRMQSALETGGVLVAIGALHLPGDEGVLALLKAQGFAIRPIPVR